MKLHCSEEMNKYTGERGEKQKKGHRHRYVDAVRACARFFCTTRKISFFLGTYLTETDILATSKNFF